MVGSGAEGGAEESFEHAVDGFDLPPLPIAGTREVVRADKVVRFCFSALLCMASFVTRHVTMKSWQLKGRSLLPFRSQVQLKIAIVNQCLVVA